MATIGEIDLAIVYNPPSNLLDANTLEEVYSYLEQPYIIISDFNAKHQFWGCERNNRNKNFLSDFAQNHSWVLMNNDEITRLGNNGQFNNNKGFDRFNTRREDLGKFSETIAVDIELENIQHID